MSRKNEKNEPVPITDGTDSRCSVGPDVSLRILVPASRAGSIIGKVAAAGQSGEVTHEVNAAGW